MGCGDLSRGPAGDGVASGQAADAASGASPGVCVGSSPEPSFNLHVACVLGLTL